MKARRVNAVLTFVLSVAAFVAAYAMTPTKHLADLRPPVDLASIFPSTFGEWRVDDRVPLQVVSPDQEALLNKIYNQTLSRSYVSRSGERIMLSVAYGGDQSDGTKAHRPEVCYPAQGFEITGNRRVELSIADRIVSARELESRLGGRYEPILYWVVVADKTTTSGAEQKLAQLRYGLRGLIPDGMLVRVSSIEQDAAQAHKRQIRFLRDLAAAMEEGHRDRVFGAVSAPDGSAAGGSVGGTVARDGHKPG